MVLYTKVSIPEFASSKKIMYICPRYYIQMEKQFDIIQDTDNIPELQSPFEQLREMDADDRE